MLRKIALLLLLAGCVVEQNLPPRALSPTLLVVNASLETLKVYDGRQYLGTIYSGETKCLSLWRKSMSYRLQFQQIFNKEYTPWFFPRPGEGWEIRIGDRLQNDVFSLQTADRCGG